MPIQICHERERLQHEVNEILRKLTKLTTSQLEAFHSDDHDRFAELDRELELTIGEKERRLGALRQHVAEHHCQEMPHGS